MGQLVVFENQVISTDAVASFQLHASAATIEVLLKSGHELKLVFSSDEKARTAFDDFKHAFAVMGVPITYLNS